MRKVFILGVIGFGMSLNSVVNAQAVEQGKIIINPYYGFPNFGKKFAEGFDLSSDVTVRGIGPCGLRAEYMVADKFGIGFDFIYNSFSVNGKADSLNTNGTLYKTYDVKLIALRMRFQARFNYHFVENDKVDVYLGVGVGHNYRHFRSKTDYPNYDDESASGVILPVSARVALGTTYYFTENFGLNAEIGLGGPVLSIGAALKF